MSFLVFLFSSNIVLWRLNLLFIGLPILELFVIWLVANMFVLLLGTLLILLEIVFSGLLGAYLVRTQGTSCLTELHRRLDRGETPTLEQSHGTLILVAGALLATPGLITDFVGILLLLYPVRSMVISYVRRKIDGQRPQPMPQSDPSPLGDDTIDV